MDLLENLFPWLSSTEGTTDHFDMRRPVDLRKQIERRLTAAMARLGFVRQRRGMYRRSMSTDITGIVTFPEKLWANVKWELCPNVGVRHDAINRLLSQISDLSKSDRSLGLLRPNLITNIGYLTPGRGHQAWSFPLDADPEPIVWDMEDRIEKYGLPFIRNLSDGRGFRDALESGLYSLADQDRDLPALCVAAGDYVTAQVYLREGIEKRVNRIDPEADQYRIFADRLCEVISERKERP